MVAAEPKGLFERASGKRSRVKALLMMLAMVGSLVLIAPEAIVGQLPTPSTTQSPDHSDNWIYMGGQLRWDRGALPNEVVVDGVVYTRPDASPMDSVTRWGPNGETETVTPSVRFSSTIGGADADDVPVAFQDQGLVAGGAMRAWQMAPLHHVFASGSGQSIIFEHGMMVDQAEAVHHNNWRMPMRLVSHVEGLTAGNSAPQVTSQPWASCNGNTASTCQWNLNVVDPDGNPWQHERRATCAGNPPGPRAHSMDGHPLRSEYRAWANPWPTFDECSAWPNQIMPLTTLDAQWPTAQNPAGFSWYVGDLKPRCDTLFSMTTHATDSAGATSAFMWMVQVMRNTMPFPCDQNPTMVKTHRLDCDTRIDASTCQHPYCEQGTYGTPPATTTPQNVVEYWTDKPDPRYGTHNDHCFPRVCVSTAFIADGAWPSNHIPYKARDLNRLSRQMHGVDGDDLIGIMSGTTGIFKPAGQWGQADFEGDLMSASSTNLYHELQTAHRMLKAGRVTAYNPGSWSLAETDADHEMVVVMTDRDGGLPALGEILEASLMRAHGVDGHLIAQQAPHLSYDRWDLLAHSFHDAGAGANHVYLTHDSLQQAIDGVFTDGSPWRAGSYRDNHEQCGGPCDTGPQPNTGRCGEHAECTDQGVGLPRSCTTDHETGAPSVTAPPSGQECASRTTFVIAQDSQAWALNGPDFANAADAEAISRSQAEHPNEHQYAVVGYDSAGVRTVKRMDSQHPATSSTLATMPAVGPTGMAGGGLDEALQAARDNHNDPAGAYDDRVVLVTDGLQLDDNDENKRYMAMARLLWGDGVRFHILQGAPYDPGDGTHHLEYMGNERFHPGSIYAAWDGYNGAAGLMRHLYGSLYDGTCITGPVPPTPPPGCPVDDYSTTLGGNLFPGPAYEVLDAFMDDDCRLHIAGRTTDDALPTTANAPMPARSPDPLTASGGAHANKDGFYAIIDRDGGSVDFATYLGGPGDDRVDSIAVMRDDSGAIISVALGGVTDDDWGPYLDGTRGHQGGVDMFYTRVAGGDTVGGLHLGSPGDDGYGGLAATGQSLVGVTSSGMQQTVPRVSANLLGGLASAPVGPTDILLYDLDFGSPESYGHWGDGSAWEVLDVHRDATDGVFVAGRVMVNSNVSSYGPLGGMSDGFGAAFAGLSSPSWVGAVGGSSHDQANGISYDAADGNLTLVGETRSSDFPVQLASYQTNHQSSAQGQLDGFKTVIDPSSGTLEESSYWGGAGEDSLVEVASTDGMTAMAGTTWSSGLTTVSGSPTTSMYQASHGGGADAFLIIDQGWHRSHATYKGASGDDAGTAVAIGPGKDTALAGTAGNGFPTTPGAFQGSGVGAEAFAATAAAPPAPPPPGGGDGGNGTGCAGATSFRTGLGFHGPAEVRAVAVDAHCRVHVVGVTHDQGWATTANAYQGTAPSAGAPGTGPCGGGGGPEDGFYAILDSTGQNLLYGTYIGGLGGDAATSVLPLPNNDTLVMGLSECVSSAFVPGSSGPLGGSPNEDMWVLRFSQSGSVTAGIQLGGDQPEGDPSPSPYNVGPIAVPGHAGGGGLAYDANTGDVYAAMQSQSATNLVPGITSATPGGSQSHGAPDWLIYRLDTSLNPQSYEFWGTSGSEEWPKVDPDASTGLFVTGVTDGTIVTTANAPPYTPTGMDLAVVRFTSALVSTPFVAGLETGAHTEPAGIAYDAARDELWVAGTTDMGATLPTAGTLFASSHSGGADAFATVYDMSATPAVYKESGYWGGFDDDVVVGLAEGDSVVVLAGYTRSPGMAMTNGGSAYFQGTIGSHGVPDQAVMIVDNLVLDHSTYIGDAHEETLMAAFVTDAGDVAVGGMISDQYPTTAGAYQDPSSPPVGHVGMAGVLT